MKSVIEILQEELGETIPPLTPYFFLWLCHFFPDKSDLLDDDYPGCQRNFFSRSKRALSDSTSTVEHEIAGVLSDLEKKFLWHPG